MSRRNPDVLGVKHTTAAASIPPKKQIPIRSSFGSSITLHTKTRTNKGVNISRIIHTKSKISASNSTLRSPTCRGCEGGEVAGHVGISENVAEAVTVPKGCFGDLNMLPFVVNVQASVGGDVNFWPSRLGRMMCGPMCRAMYTSLTGKSSSVRSSSHFVTGTPRDRDMTTASKMPSRQG